MSPVFSLPLEEMGPASHQALWGGEYLTHRKEVQMLDNQKSDSCSLEPSSVCWGILQTVPNSSLFLLSSLLPYNLLESCGQGDPSHSKMLDSIKIIHVLTLVCDLQDTSRCPISRLLQWAWTVKFVLSSFCHLHGNMLRLARQRMRDMCAWAKVLSQPVSWSASWQPGKLQTCAWAQPRSVNPSCQQPPVDPNAWAINTCCHTPLRFCGHLLQGVIFTMDSWYHLPALCR